MNLKLTIWGVKLEKSKIVRNIPNLITITRLFLTIFFLILCLNTRLYLGILFTFLLICISDIIDGKIARYLNSVTKLGSILDVLIDSFFIFSALGILCCQEHVIPLWFILIVFINLVVFITTSYIIQKFSINSRNFFVFDLIGRISAILFYLIPGIAYSVIYLNLNSKLILKCIISVNTVLALAACISRITKLSISKDKPL